MTKKFPLEMPNKEALLILVALLLPQTVTVTTGLIEYVWFDFLERQGFYLTISQ